jgi:hypothetical protein
MLYGAVLFSLIIHARQDWFSLLKESGLIYLMFIVGTERIDTPPGPDIVGVALTGEFQ